MATAPRARFAPGLCLLALALHALPAEAGDSAPGSISVHEEGAAGAPHNDPRVGCPFLIEGLSMGATSGPLVIKAWPPTGDKRVVLNTTWSVDGGGQPGENHFVAGPFTLPSGHYKAFIGNGLDHTVTKIFWAVCEGEPAPAPCEGDIALAGRFFVHAGNAYATLAQAPLRAGDEVTAVFTLTGCGEMGLGLASYDTDAAFRIERHILFDGDSGTFVEGVHTLDVLVPPCFFEVDFVLGGVIGHFHPPDHTYEGRLVKRAQGGAACPEGTPTTQIPFFPSAAALAVGVGGALAGSFLLLRRR